MNADGGDGREVLVAFPGLLFALAVVVDGGFGGGGADAGEHAGGLAFHLDDEWDFAAEANAGLFGDGGGEHGGDAGVDGIAALLEEPVAGLDFEVVGGGDHFFGAADSGEHGVLSVDRSGEQKDSGQRELH